MRKILAVIAMVLAATAVFYVQLQKTPAVVIDSSQSFGNERVLKDPGITETKKPSEKEEKKEISHSHESVSLSMCQEITKPGSYTLAADLHADGSACISIHDTHDVTLDCAHHRIRGDEGLRIHTVRTFSVENCTIESTSLKAIMITDSSDGRIVRNTIGKYHTEVQNSSRLYINANQFKSTYAQYYTNDSEISNNEFDVTVDKSYTVLPGAIISAFGTRNIVASNIVDGHAGGDFSDQTGSDDGIVIAQESGDKVHDNTLKNFFDCGIETTGVITNTDFARNKISNAGYCGIGGWYGSSWIGNTVTGNTVDTTPMLFYFTRIYGLMPQGADERHLMPEERAVYFKDNVFTKNVLRDAKKSATVPSRSGVFNISLPDTLTSNGSHDVRPTQEQMVTGNNRFKDNDFGTAMPLFIMPAPMVVDDGGNICTHDQIGFPLTCAPGARSI
jgi:hypothetical protein